MPPPPSLGEKYPMVKRPYRTQQDLIIQDSAGASSSHNQFIGGGVSKTDSSGYSSRRAHAAGGGRSAVKRGATDIRSRCEQESSTDSMQGAITWT